MQDATIVSELTVFLKGGHSSYKQQFLLYDTYTVRPDDVVIADCIRLAKSEFRGDVDDVKIKITIQV